MANENYIESFRGRSVLITGGLGFIGSNLAHRLVGLGDVKITVLDSLVPGQGGNIFNVHSIRDSVDVHIGDMADETEIIPLLGGIDYIFNLAGSAGHIDSMAQPKQDLHSNCTAQLTLLEACRKFNPQAKIIFTSTRQVYGKPLNLPVDEHHRLLPLDINGVNKLAAENYHNIYYQTYGLRTVCLRLTNTFGPRQLLLHDRQGFVPWFIRKAIDGETIQLYGGGKQRRDLNFVEDVLDALLLCAAAESADGEVYNLGDSRVITLDWLATELIGITGIGSIQSVPFPAERQNIEIGNVYSSFEKIRNELGWQPRTDLREGLARTVEFYQQNREYYWTRATNPFSRSIKAA